MALRPTDLPVHGALDQALLLDVLSSRHYWHNLALSREMSTLRRESIKRWCVCDYLTDSGSGSRILGRSRQANDRIRYNILK